MAFNSVHEVNTMRVDFLCGHSLITGLLSASATVFDLGVNYGGFITEIAPLCGHVIGFEPDPHWARNCNFAPNVTVIEKALAGERGFVNLNQNRMQFSSLHYADEGAPTIEVQAITLDDALMLSSTRKIDLILIRK
jgi:FkbM family methyltransferase